MTGPGNFARVIVNGWDLTGDAREISYSHTYKDSQVMAQNVGVQQHAPGSFAPKLTLGGYARRGMGQITAANLLAPSGIGNTNDTELIITALLGNNSSPAVGDCAAVFDGTLLDYKRHNPRAATQLWNATFSPRGKRMPPFPVLILDGNQKNSLTSAVYDDGAESVGSVNGGVGVLQVTTPTGVQATGTLTLSGQPSDGDTFTLNFGGSTIVYTFKTALTPTAGQVLIGATAAATAANLFQAMTGALSGSGTNYAAGTTVVPAATIIVSVPSGSNVITLTAVATGTAANAYTLAKTGVNLAVSGATMSGGVAGETATIVLQSATSSGGSYTTFLTFTSDMTVRKAERIEVAIGTTINRFLKAVITMSGGTQTWAANIVFGRYFQA